ncbi:PAS domain-containing sensor histidine kinase [Myxococcus sp. CA056]|uniref:PAS domain-containing sensor histidine kinase n=2 Tax=Myxococcus TaxID=32 RepID=UPI00157A590D|nr:MULTISPECIES: PAS domain-containing sensor histidine kinase [unclassified Myxococcus]NTX09375.1 PAS domain-containing sensor histidine kinase [Myxococcus sp. CA056]NTX37737.1 PAS domain-containing sensor histidine kinase [Myxococcus sp. CA033]NTX50623.1 PAS domain-containing sensor histidine kinase [Myxococcus sp. CA039A]
MQSGRWSNRLMSGAGAPPSEAVMVLRSVRSAGHGILDFECVSANVHAERWLGRDERPLVRQRLLEEAPWVGECGLFAACVRVAVRREPEVVRVSRQSSVGLVWLLARVSPWEDGVVVFLEDLTERMAAEETLRRDHDLLHAVIESATDAIYVKDVDARYVLINPATARAFNRAPQDILGRTDLELLGEDVAGPTLAHDRAVMESGVTATYEDSEGGPGSDRIWQTTKGVLRRGDSTVYGLFGISRDVTARRRQELERDEEARFQERFIGVLGHDLGNPLAAVRLSAAALLAQATLTPEARRVAQRIDGSAERMARLVKQLLDFTRARMAGGIPLRPREVCMESVCRRIISELEPAHPQHQVDLEVDGESRGIWDEERLGQVLSNLVGNALQHSPSGTSVRVRLAASDPLFQRVEVHNLGPPIPDSLRPRLFAPFHRATPEPGMPRPHRHGLGLGLYIVSQIVTAHGGWVDVASSLEAGTCFSVTLPRVVQAQDETQTRWA